MRMENLMADKLELCDEVPNFKTHKTSQQFLLRINAPQGRGRRPRLEVSSVWGQLLKMTWKNYIREVTVYSTLKLSKT